MYKELAEMDASYDHTMKNPRQYAKAVVVKIDNAKVEVKTFAAMLNIYTIRVTLASSLSTPHIIRSMMNCLSTRNTQEVILASRKSGLIVLPQEELLNGKSGRWTRIPKMQSTC